MSDGRKPASGVESRYLLVGMALCGSCGGGLQVSSRSHGRTRAYFYGCPRANVSRCENDLLVPMTMADSAAIAMMTDDVLSADVIERALTKLVALLNGPEEDVAERRTRLSELSRLGREQIETAMALKQLSTAGVRCFGCVSERPNAATTERLKTGHCR